MSVARTGLRLFSSASPRASAFAYRSALLRHHARVVRMYATDATATPNATVVAKESLLSRLWNGPVGVKTVHFWAPVMKWALVLAGITDFARPAEKLSLAQNASLTATGAIWTRWCFVIKPKNYLLATVNFFLASVGIVQCSRVFIYRANEKRKSHPKSVKDSA